MKLRRYCVTVSDNWTPMRLFWTRRGAVRFWEQHDPAHLFVWKDGAWLSGSYIGSPKKLRTYPTRAA